MIHTSRSVPTPLARSGDNGVPAGSRGGASGRDAATYLTALLAALATAAFVACALSLIAPPK